MSSHRLSRSLATLAQPTSSSSSSSSLVPPYSHSLNKTQAAPPQAFKPPYAFSLGTPSKDAQGKLSARLRFSMIRHTDLDIARMEVFNTWAKEQLSSEQGRASLWKAWKESIIGLDSGSDIPRVSFTSLDHHLKQESTLEAIMNAGVLVVSDVVADREAEEWATEVFKEFNQRNGRSSYWSPSLIAARAHASVLSANNQVLSAVSGTKGSPYIQADAPQAGIGASGASTTSMHSPWTVDDKSLAPTTPLLAHLALTASSPGQIVPSVHAAIYASLRPLFTPARSKISFHNTTSYLDPANWNLVTPDAILTYTPGSTPHFPHLVEASVSLPRLNPGDIVYRHSAIPLTSSSLPSKGQGAFLPVSPLPQNEINGAYILEQRQAFEKGTPPPHAIGESLVALENAGSIGDIPSSGGKTAMGY